MTNAHVVEGCRSITATYIDHETRQSYEAALRYYDKRTDVAVLKIPAQRLDHFSLRPWLSYEQTDVGERVYAIGNPRGFEQSITEGIFSGNRESGGISWVQHSAPISPGSSGGALIGSRGELLGINAFMLEDSQNLNFAVPAGTLIRALSKASAVTGSLSFPPAPEAPVSATADQVRHWRSAAEQGDAEAITRLSKAAENGDALAQLNLGLLFFDGRGVSKDLAAAARWIQKAADQGNAEAEASVGVEYALGKGVPQNYAIAASWFRKAAEQGFAPAQNDLALLYDEGKGVQEDRTESAIWYRKAAEQGYAAAQLNLGVAYMNGSGVLQDFSRAYFWIKVAAAGRITDVEQEDVAALLLVIGNHLTPAAVSQVREDARQWIAAHPEPRQ